MEFTKFERVLSIYMFRPTHSTNTLLTNHVDIIPEYTKIIIGLIPRVKGHQMPTAKAGAFFIPDIFV